MPEKEKDKSKVVTEEELVPVLVFKTEVVIEGEKGQEEPAEKEQKVRNINWTLVGTVLAAIGIAIFIFVFAQYSQYQESHFAGNYTVNREPFLPMNATHSVTRIDDNYSLWIAIYDNNDSNIAISMSLVSQGDNKPDPAVVEYSIKSLVLRGKETKRLIIDERIIPGTRVVGMFNSSTSELGHTLDLEISLVTRNTSVSYTTPFFYNLEILRESSGRIYYVRAKDPNLKREPGFEGIIGFAAVAIIAVLIKRKKE